MPLYDFVCQQGHREERFMASFREADETAYQCATCVSVMVRERACGGRGLLWFEEGRERVIENLGAEPVRIRSARDHKRAMKAAGVVEAGNRQGDKGCWV